MSSVRSRRRWSHQRNPPAVATHESKEGDEEKVTTSRISPSSTSRSGRTLKKRKFEDYESDSEDSEHEKVTPSHHKKQKMTTATGKRNSKHELATKLSQRKKSNKFVNDDDEEEMKSVGERSGDEEEGDEDDADEEVDMSDAESRADEWRPEDDKDDDSEYDEDGDVKSHPASVAVPRTTSSHPSTSFMDVIESEHTSRGDTELIARMLTRALENPTLDINQQSSHTGNSLAFVLYSILMTERGRNECKQHLMPIWRTIFKRIEKTLDIRILNKKRHNFLHHICSPSTYPDNTLHHHVELIQQLLYDCLGWKMSLYTPDAEGNYPLHDLAKSCARGRLSDKLFYSFITPRRKYSIDLSHVDKDGVSALSHLFCSGWEKGRTKYVLMRILQSIARQPALLGQVDLENENTKKQSLREVLSHFKQSEAKLFLEAWDKAALPKLRSEVGVHLIKDLTEMVLEYVVKVEKKEKQMPEQEEEKKNYNNEVKNNAKNSDDEDEDSEDDSEDEDEDEDEEEMKQDNENPPITTQGSLSLLHELFGLDE